jgi:hypothetical protein
MAGSSDVTRTVGLAVTNFSGGKRHSGGGVIDADALADLALLADKIRSDDGFVLSIQEMTTTDAGVPTRAAALEASIAEGARSTFVPLVSTQWHPIRKKWGDKVDQGSSRNEGLCVATGDMGAVLCNWSSAPWQSMAGPIGGETRNRVVELPNFEFPKSLDDGEGQDWIRGEYLLNDVRTPVVFRPAYYRGYRDTDPRAAQACLLGWPQREGDHQTQERPACVLINLHLSTLTSELLSERRGRASDANATFLRSMQLRAIARFARQMQDETEGLPVVIAGDFNSEPDSPEIREFSDEINSAPELTAGKCWKCGTRQVERPEVCFYSQTPGRWDYSLLPCVAGQPPNLCTTAVCCNDQCLEPRFTHKWHGLLLDNVFVLPALSGSEWDIAVGKPEVDVSRPYSDHAAVIVPLIFTKRVSDTLVKGIGNATFFRH